MMEGLRVEVVEMLRESVVLNNTLAEHWQELSEAAEDQDGATQQQAMRVYSE